MLGLCCLSGNRKSGKVNQVSNSKSPVPAPKESDIANNNDS